MTKGKGKFPGFGSLGKHMKSNIHKERGQLESRKKLGALEKHKDYVKRAQVRHKKVAKLQQLKRAANLRNPDEFHLKMTQMQMDPATGKMVKKQDNTPAGKRRRNLEALAENRKDLDYIRYKMREDRRKAIELADDVVGLDAPPQNKHTVFVDDEEAVRSFDPVQHFNAVDFNDLKAPALRGNRTRVATQVAQDALHPVVSGEEREAVALAFREVAQRSARYRKLKDLSQSLESKERKLRNVLDQRAKQKFKKGAPVRAR